MKARIVHNFTDDEESYDFPNIKVIDEEATDFSIGDIGFQTLLVLQHENTTCKAGKEWIMISQIPSYDEVSVWRTVRLKAYCIKVHNENGSLLTQETYKTQREMLFIFESRYDPDKSKIKARCAICGLPLDEFYSDYPNPVCRYCDRKALNTRGKKPEWESNYDSGENPVFIDGQKCWRRYRFGGYITMFDNLDCQDLKEFYSRVFKW